jgi:uracil-DNA glycosylase family 4
VSPANSRKFIPLPAPSSRAERLVRQHARTSELLGVDFVPVYRRSGAGDETAPEPAISQSTSSTDVVVLEPVESLPAPDARDAGANGRLLEALRERYIQDAPHKAFVTSFNKIVFGEGHAAARLMFIGEAPGADEDRTGRPFVGRAGQLLDKMIVAMGLSREQVYIANVLKTRPPDNATPTSEECQACSPYLFEQVAIIRPEVIVTLGLPASRTVLGTDLTMSAMRGRWASYRYVPPLLGSLSEAGAVASAGGGLVIPVMPTYHPAFLLRSYTEENRRKVWSDLRQVMDRLGLSTEPKDQGLVGG